MLQWVRPWVYASFAVHFLCLFFGSSAGEVCTEWLTWSQYLGVHSIFLQSLLQAFVYNALAVSLWCWLYALDTLTDIGRLHSLQVPLFLYCHTPLCEYAYFIIMWTTTENNVPLVPFILAVRRIWIRSRLLRVAYLWHLQFQKSRQCVCYAN